MTRICESTGVGTYREERKRGRIGSGAAMRVSIQRARRVYRASSSSRSKEVTSERKEQSSKEGDAKRK